MMQVRLTVFALLAAALAGCTDGPSEPVDHGPVGRIDGAVLDHVMMPFGNTSVHLVEQDVRTRTTDLGGFSFVGVPPGFHTIEVFVEGFGFDREIVAVDGGETTKTILQIIPDPEDKPHITVLSDSTIVQVALPGEHCEECEWRGGLKDHIRPDLVFAQATWRAEHPVASGIETHLVMELRDQDGTLLMGPLDRDDAVREGDFFTLQGVVQGDTIPPSAGNLVLHFEFDPDNKPQPDFKMQSSLDLHYGETEQVQAQLGA